MMNQLKETENDLQEKTWNGNPPPCCVGKCNLFGVTLTQCANCEWDDDNTAGSENL